MAASASLAVPALHADTSRGPIEILPSRKKPSSTLQMLLDHWNETFGQYPAPYSSDYSLCEVMANLIDEANAHIAACYSNFMPYSTSSPLNMEFFTPPLEVRKGQIITGAKLALRARLCA